MPTKKKPILNDGFMGFSFELYSLDADTLCHEKELYVSDSFSTYDEAMDCGMEMLEKISLEMGDELVELNVWSFERLSYVTEIIYRNGEESKCA